MYVLVTSYTLIMFLKVLSHFIMKIKNFIKYRVAQKNVLNIRMRCDQSYLPIFKISSLLHSVVN